MIAKEERPMVEVAPIDPQESRAAPRLGFMSGEIDVPDDFDAMGSDDVAALFGAVEAPRRGAST